MAKPFGGKRPQDLRHTLRRFMDYLGRHKIMLGVVGLLAAVSALAALLGTYMIRPIVNGVLENGSAAYLAGVVALTAGIYAVGALSTLGYTSSWSAPHRRFCRTSAATSSRICRRCRCTTLTRTARAI